MKKASPQKIRIIKYIPNSFKVIYLDKSTMTETEVDKHPWDYTEEEELIIQEFNQDFDIGYQNMTQRYREFNNKSLYEMIGILADKYNIHLKSKDGEICKEDDWMFNTKHPLTHTKIMVILSHIVANNLGVKFQAFNNNNEVDYNTSEVFNLILENLQKASGSQHEVQKMHNALNALIMPASIQKVLLDVDYEEIWDSGSRLKQIPLQNFFIDNPYTRRLQDQRFIIENYTIPFARLRTMFSDTGKLDLVQDNQWARYQAQSFIYEKNKLALNNSGRADARRVVISEYYNKGAQVKSYFANGVLMKTEKFTLKSYPYRKTIYREFANTEFFYGLCLAQILLPTQMTIDTLINNYLNTEILNANPSWLMVGDNVGDFNYVNTPNQVMIAGSGTTLHPMRPQVQSQGLANATALERNIMSEASADALAGGRTEKYVSARGSVLAQNNFQTIVGYFDSQISLAELDYAYIAMEQIMDTLTYKKLDDMGIPIYSSMFTQDKMGVLFDINVVDTEDAMLEKSYELLKLEKKKGVKLKLVNPEILKKARYRIYANTEKEFEGTTVEREARMMERWTALRTVYQFDAEMLNKINEAFSQILFRGVDIPKGLFDRPPIVPQNGQQTGGALGNPYNQNNASVAGLNAAKSFNNNPGVPVQ